MWWINNSGVNTLKGEPQYVHEDGTHLRNIIEAENYIAVYGGEYSPWTDDLGNTPDPSNQIQLEDVAILRNIHTIRNAREDFFKILGTLNYKEQYRLNTLLSRSPFATSLIKPETEKVDGLVSNSAKSGVRVSGRFGGTRIGG